VLTNLLANARTHTPAGTQVTVRLVQREDEVEILVQDDGPGVPEGLQSEVFDRFVRTDDGRARSAGGTGLGLAITHAVATAHGGWVDLTSRPSHTAFRVCLPRRVEP
jgi:two-component system, OmpR family, sensor kinase